MKYFVPTHWNETTISSYYSTQENKFQVDLQLYTKIILQEQQKKV